MPRRPLPVQYISMRPSNTPSSSDVSVVLQGPIQQQTASVISSVRRVLPSAEVILSTWENSDVSGLAADIVITSPDPGSIPSGLPGPRATSNINRQIVSTQAGLEKASRPYILKARTDTVFHSANFLGAIHAFPAHGKYHVLKERIVTPTRITLDPRRCPHAMHMSDWVHAGLAEDIRLLWSLPLVTEEEALYWNSSTTPLPKEEAIWLRDYRSRLAPEQYLFTHLMKNTTLPLPAHVWDTSPELIVSTERAIADNLVLLSPKNYGFSFSKYPWPLVQRGICYTQAEFAELYKRHCAILPTPLLPLLRIPSDITAASITHARSSSTLRKLLKK